MATQQKSNLEGMLQVGETCLKNELYDAAADLFAQIAESAGRASFSDLRIKARRLLGEAFLSKGDYFLREGLLEQAVTTYTFASNFAGTFDFPELAEISAKQVALIEAYTPEQKVQLYFEAGKRHEDKALSLLRMGISESGLEEFCTARARYITAGLLFGAHEEAWRRLSVVEYYVELLEKEPQVPQPEESFRSMDKYVN